MRLTELILPKSSSRKDLHADKVSRIDFLKNRILSYADKLNSPLTTPVQADFLKKKIEDDKAELEVCLDEIRQADNPIKESINTLPLVDEDFDKLKKLMENPIPVVVAKIYTQDIIDDDELTDQFCSLEQSDPGFDARELIADWIKRVMPDQLYRFRDETGNTDGNLSPIHGYDTGSYRSDGSLLNGNAVGRF